MVSVNSTNNGARFQIAINERLDIIKKILIIFSPIFYLGILNVIIRYDIFSLWKQLIHISTTKSSSLLTNVRVGAHPEVVVWRMKLIPIYWSRIGNLHMFHNIFLVVYFGCVIKMFFLNGYSFGRLNFNIKNIFTFDKIKKFWIFFGIVAFITSTFSYFPILNELFMIIYSLLYFISIIITPITIYFYWVNRSDKFKDE